MSFLFDDFFADPDASVEIKPQLWQNGDLVEVPMQVRRRLSLGQREAIKQGSVAFEVDTVNGTYTPKAVDQEKLTVMTLMALIVSWPFTYKDGTPVPVNDKTVRALGSTNADAILMEISKLDTRRQEDAAPFVGPSEAA
jgi:hypothetical protein